jgi:hypothetical protein
MTMFLVRLNAEFSQIGDSDDLPEKFFAAALIILATSR